ncbi:alpha carbonic anhydrase 8-like [Aricia agestis]|uniref:alpha carbonic anhydrase 8-like n=1 Tax=Aricia agestis TaxID=91739 RepID=UPI001C20AE1A|nr:alpha carbonic anhydrase 8-like [Aricia agestis]
MKCFLILLFVFCYGDCRKVLPIDKSANTAFINMEAGGVRAPNPAPAPVKPQPVQPAPSSPQTQHTPSTPKPVPKQEPTPTVPHKPTPPQIPPKPVNPPQPANPITTPGPGSVKQLITFYDSQGKASPIRPYTYSQAVKQG